MTDNPIKVNIFKANSEYFLVNFFIKLNTQIILAFKLKEKIWVFGII